VFVTGGLQRASITSQDKLHFQAPHAAKQGIDQSLLVIDLHNQAINHDAQIVPA
jgi:hypothetical protein